MYANVLGSIDLFVIGMIGCRLLYYLPSRINFKIVKLLRIIGVLFLILISFLFSDARHLLIDISPSFEIASKGLGLSYRLIGPILFTSVTIGLVLLYSYREEEIGTNNERFIKMRTLIGKICNSCSPYTFMFYLWHSILLAMIANKLVIANVNQHYFTTLAVGIVVTAYIAYLMTNMNNGIIKHILKK